MNSLERSVRRLLRSPEIGSSLVREALQTCPDRRLSLAQLMGSSSRGSLSERTYYRAKKELVERIVEMLADGKVDLKSAPHKHVQDRTPIALPMVDRLTPEPIAAVHYQGPDRGRALSAAALSAEMSGEQNRADELLSEAGQHVRNQFGNRDILSSFEVCQNELYIARCRGDLQAMRNCVRQTARLRDRLSPAERLKVSLDCSEVYLYEGRLRDARAELDFSVLNASCGEGTLLRSIGLVRGAQIALTNHDFDAAEQAAMAALKIGKPHADIRVYAAEVLGRSSLQTGRRWSSKGLEECQSLFHSLSVRTVLARHYLKRRKLAAAFETAQGSYDEAMRFHYWNLASRSAVTIAMCLTDAERKHWLAQGLQLYLSSKRENAYVGDDLFDIRPDALQTARSFLLSDDSLVSLAKTYLQRFPDSVLEAGSESLLLALTEFLLRGALREHVSTSMLTSPSKRLLQQSSGLQELTREACRLGRFIAALSVLAPFEQRSDFIAGNRRQVHRAVDILRRSLARRHWQRLRDGL